MKIKEIADNNSSISSTRWAYASVIKFDMVIISVVLGLFALFHLIDKPLDNSFFYAVGTLLGILTTMVATPKALQGFEPRNDDFKKIAENMEKKDKELMENDGK